MRAAPLPTTSVSLRLPIGSGGNRFQQLHHRLIGPVVRVLVDLGVAARADRRIDVLALAEAVPELPHLVGRHVVGASRRRRFARHQPQIHQKAMANANGSSAAKRVMVAMRRFSVTSNSALRLSLFARSFTSLFRARYSKTMKNAPIPRPISKPCSKGFMARTLAWV